MLPIKSIYMQVLLPLHNLLISGESWALTRALIAFMSLLACFVQCLFTSLPLFTLYEILWCCHISSYIHSAELTIIFQRSMVWSERPFDKLVGDWLTKMPEGLSWLPYFRVNFRAAPKNSWLSKLPHFPPARSSHEVKHSCCIHLFHGLCYCSTLSVLLQCTQSVAQAQLMHSHSLS